MAWYWSDDVARAAIEAGLISEQAAREWLNRPVAHALEAGTSHLDAAQTLMSPDADRVRGAA